MFDGFRNETFDLRVMLFCTINDFPAYGNLSRYNVKAIVHASSVKKTQAAYNCNMVEKQYTLGINIF